MTASSSMVAHGRNFGFLHNAVSRINLDTLKQEFPRRTMSNQGQFVSRTPAQYRYRYRTVFHGVRGRGHING